MTQDAQVQEANVSAVVTADASAQISEANVSAVARIATDARISEANVSAVVKVFTGANVQEANVSAVVYHAPCATQRADTWKITRTDGTVLGFTSLDSDFELLGVTYHSCDSLMDSASESSSDVGQIGSVTLTGLISDDMITEADLYAGLYDDCYVEAWLINWGLDEDPGAPIRLAAGWAGKVTRGQASYEAEVLGPGTRLAQTALIQFFTPGCRWAFGDAKCTVNAAALAIAGVTVTGAIQRFGVQFTPQAVPPETALWTNGTVTWTSGDNAGIVCQVEAVDWTAGALSLWDLAPFVPAIGDTFTVTPGCSYDKTGCKLYGNYINYGGFHDVPGPDSLQQNADALFTGNNG